MFGKFVLAASAAGLYTTTAASPLQPRADGCGTQHHPGYNDDTNSHSIMSGGRTRHYAVNVPQDYNSNPNKRRAVIFDYHGNTRSPHDQYLDSMYYASPGGDDYLVVYPAGVDSHWQGPSYATPGVNDLQFTTDLLDHIRKSYCVDDNRVYASGKSNGAGFVDTLACSDHGDEFAAFAMASAALYTDTSEGDCPKKRAILESHGDKDTTIPYSGGEGSGGPLPDIGEWVSWWGQRTCPGTGPVKSGDMGGYDITTYSCGSYNKVIDHYQVFDLGHCWPSSNGKNFDSTKSTCKDRSLDFTKVVLKFFGRWNLSSAPH